jgi:hypothetical protein
VVAVGAAAAAVVGLVGNARGSGRVGMAAAAAAVAVAFATGAVAILNFRIPEYAKL